MNRCGDCVNYIPASADGGADEGYCTAILDEDGIGKIVGVFSEAKECKLFDAESVTRIRTDNTEFTCDASFRPQRGFDEK